MRNKIIIGATIFFIILVLGNSIFGKTGFITLYRMRKETMALEHQVALEELRKDSLELVKKRLQSDPEYIERVAREELGYCHEDETLLKIIPVERKEQ